MCKCMEIAKPSAMKLNHTTHKRMFFIKSCVWIYILTVLLSNFNNTFIQQVKKYMFHVIAIFIPIFIKPDAIVRALVVGHTSPKQTPPIIPLHMS